MCQKKLFYYLKDKQANKYYKVINLKQKKSRKNYMSIKNIYQVLTLTNLFIYKKICKEKKKLQTNI